MIPFVIIRKVVLTLTPLFLFYFLRKMGKREQARRKSLLSDFDKDKIVDGEIVREE